jgi:hypothetical protein
MCSAAESRHEHEYRPRGVASRRGPEAFPADHLLPGDKERVEIRTEELAWILSKVRGGRVLAEGRTLPEQSDLQENS